MTSRIERVAAFVDDLIHNRRPRRFEASAEELDALQSAAALRSARPASDLPDRDFVARLGRQIESRMTPSAPSPGFLTRRTLLRSAGLAAAAGIAGAVADRSVVLHPGDQQGTLAPAQGVWRQVAAEADLPIGRAIRFSSGSVEGVLVNDGQTVTAVSAVCTHQGCVLLLEATARRLRCPCHPTIFSLSGKLVSHQLPTPPANLPIVQARVRDGYIEVLVV